MNIKAKRREMGWTQMHLAYASGVSRFRIQLAEKGYIALREEEIDRIKTSLNEKTRSAKGTNHFTKSMR